MFFPLINQVLQIQALTVRYINSKSGVGM